MKKIQISRPVVDWSNHSKSAIAIAKNQPINQWCNEWNEFTLIPEYNTVGFGFWTTLGHGGLNHQCMSIYQKFVPAFDGDAAHSLVVRPEIEEAIRKHFKVKTPPYKWSDKFIYSVNFWLRQNILGK